MAESADRATLIIQTIEWLVATGSLNTVAELESMLSLAGFDNHLKGQIEREGEARPLNNLAWTYDDLGRRTEALRLYEEALPIMREVGDRAGEATTLANIAQLLAQLESISEAIEQLRKAIAVMRDSELTHDAGGVSLEQREALLEKWQSG